ncbi:MAG: hypothetical protein ACTS6G_06080 [Candidatus Hodgkinia cicadicola]
MSHQTNERGRSNERKGLSLYLYIKYLGPRVVSQNIWSVSAFLRQSKQLTPPAVSFR